jgi:hypothetical protein
MLATPAMHGTLLSRLGLTLNTHHIFSLIICIPLEGLRVESYGTGTQVRYVTSHGNIVPLPSRYSRRRIAAATSPFLFCVFDTGSSLFSFVSLLFVDCPVEQPWNHEYSNLGHRTRTCTHHSPPRRKMLPTLLETVCSSYVVAEPLSRRLPLVGKTVPTN